MEEGRSSSLEQQEEKDKLAATFRGITASTQEEALFFLESHDWILDSAILSFYDNHPDPPAASPPPRPRPQPQSRHQEEDDDPDDQDEDYAPPEAAPAPVLAPRVTRSTAASAGGAAAASPSRVTRSSSAAMGSRPDKMKAPKPSSGRSTIRTLADLNRSSDPGSDSDSDGPQEYYTGGEKSGMLVQDPSKGGNEVDSIFEKARQMGATQGPLEPQQPSSSRSFTGIGRLLSGESVPSAPAPQQPETIVHNIYLWRNGFTVDNGPLRRFDDPDNASFLESIRKTECPKELEPPDRRSAITVTLHRMEGNYSEPVKRQSPFQGAGRTLGGGSSDNSVTETATYNATASSTAPPSFGLSVDDSLPSTSVQLRLADGTRMVARFNTHHTVGDIRAFIDASRPGSSRTYQLQAVGFPPKPLNDYAKTIEEAGLANSVIIQKG